MQNVVKTSIGEVHLKPFVNLRQAKEFFNRYLSDQKISAAEDMETTMGANLEGQTYLAVELTAQLIKDDGTVITDKSELEKLYVEMPYPEFAELAAECAIRLAPEKDKMGKS